MFFLLKNNRARGPKEFVSRKRIAFFFWKKSIPFLLTKPKSNFWFVSALISADFGKFFLLRLLNNNLNKKIFSKSAEINALTKPKSNFGFVSRKRIHFFEKKNEILFLLTNFFGRRALTLLVKEKCNPLPADRFFWSAVVDIWLGFKSDPASTKMAVLFLLTSFFGQRFVMFG